MYILLTTTTVILKCLALVPSFLSRSDILDVFFLRGKSEVKGNTMECVRHPLEQRTLVYCKSCLLTRCLCREWEEEGMWQDFKKRLSVLLFSSSSLPRGNLQTSLASFRFREVQLDSPLPVLSSLLFVIVFPKCTVTFSSVMSLGEGEGVLL